MQADLHGHSQAAWHTRQGEDVSFILCPAESTSIISYACVLRVLAAQLEANL